MRRPVLAGALVLALVGCSGTDPVRDPGARGAVRQRFDDWVKAWNAAKPDSLAEFYIHKEHLTVVWPNGDRTRGWQQESESQRTFFPSVMVMNLVPRDPVVVLARKNLAVVSFGFSLDMFAGGRRQIGPGQGTMVWQLEGGKWRIYSAQLSYTSATAAQLQDRPRRVIRR